MEALEQQQQQRQQHVAVIIGYRGSEFSGSQYNIGVRTVDGELVRAFLSLGLLPPPEVRAPQPGDRIRMHPSPFRGQRWTRCSRTDRGVSAVSALITTRVVASSLSFAEITSALNTQLPPDIHVHALCSLEDGSFCAGDHATGRFYEYLVPASMLFGKLDRAEMNALLAHFAGEHDFHNFTRKMTHDDSERMHTVYGVTVAESLFVAGGDQSPWVVIEIRGKTFMIYQIRKMMGFFFALVNARATPRQADAAFKAAYTSPTFIIPAAPAEGLFLNRPLYDDFDVGADGREVELQRFRQIVMQHIASTSMSAFNKWNQTPQTAIADTFSKML